MSVPRIRLETVEAIARKILMEYDSSLLSGEPRPIPIEAIIEVKFNLILEYHILRKNGAVLGETIFDDGPVILYDMDERSYKVIAVRKGTILLMNAFVKPAVSGGCASHVPMSWPTGCYISNCILKQEILPHTMDSALLTRVME